MKLRRIKIVSLILAFVAVLMTAAPAFAWHRHHYYRPYYRSYSYGYYDPYYRPYYYNDYYGPYYRPYYGPGVSVGVPGFSFYVGP